MYFEILEYPIERDSQNTFIIAAITRFFATADCVPVLVFDRGFACPSIIHFLAQNQHQFIIRIKKRKLLTHATGTAIAAEEFTEHDCVVRAYGTTLRLIRSDDPKNGNDPWYLITNDTRSTRAAIISMYYHRFEIEEFFRDAKHLLGFEHLTFKTAQSLSMALWFALLTTWFFERMTLLLTSAQEAERKRWNVSHFRYVLERLSHELLHPRDERPYTLFLPFV